LAENIIVRDMYIPLSLDIKNQEVFYQENVNHADILWGMPVLDKKYLSATFIKFITTSKRSLLSWHKSVSQSPTKNKTFKV